MAFQDFDLITERRKSEKRQQLKKRILIGVVSTVVLAGLIGCAFFVVTSKHGVLGGSNTKEESSQNSKEGSKQHIVHSERIVKLVCSSADYKEKCEGPLNKAVDADPKLQHPKDLLKAYIKVVEGEVTKAFDKTNTFKFESEQEKGAFEDCKKLFTDAKDDLQTSIDQLTTIEFKKLSSKAPDLNSWLSVVISKTYTGRYI
jgi:pectinesterase inhibitor-like protein